MNSVIKYWKKYQKTQSNVFISLKTNQTGKFSIIFWNFFSSIENCSFEHHLSYLIFLLLPIGRFSRYVKKK